MMNDLRFRVVGVIALFFYLYTPCCAAPKVVVGIKPIHALVAGIMKGVGEPQLLIPAYESPHHFQLSPSKANLMNQANLFIWVGPQLETILERPIKNLVKRGKRLELMNIPTLTLHTQRSGQTDPHIWLDPENAKTIVALVTQTLSELDPEAKPIYEENAVALLKDIDELTKTLKEELEGLQKKKYFVYHNAYQYFDHAFDLQRGTPVVLENSPELRARQRLKLERLAHQDNIACIFAEPQHGVKIIENLADELGLKIGILDPLGIDIEDKEQNAYIIMMRKIAKSLKSCLKQEPINDES